MPPKCLRSKGLARASLPECWSSSPRKHGRTMHRARQTCIECPALKRGLCGTLSVEELARLSRAAWCRHYEAGQIIHADGLTPASFSEVICGVVKILTSLPNGAQQIVGLLLPGDCLGRPLGQESR